MIGRHKREKLNAGHRGSVRLVASLKDKLDGRSKGEFFIITAALVSIIIFTNYRFLGELSSLETKGYGRGQITFVKSNLERELEQTTSEKEMREMLTFVRESLAREGYVLDYEVFPESSYYCANVTISSNRYHIKDKICNGS